jgi:hypothetical protein
MLLLRKVVWLFCLVTLRFPKPKRPHHALGTIGKPQWVGLHGDGFVVFRHTMQEILNIEQFCNWTFKKIETQIPKAIWGMLLVLMESSSSVGFYGDEFVIFGPNVHEILNFEYFFSLEFQYNVQKLNLKMKFQT